MRSRDCRPLGRLFCFAALILVCAPGLRAASTAPATTLVQDTIYRANGTPARGTIVISWPPFETPDHKTVAAGVVSVALGDAGSLSVPLVPNQGATPLGTYYKVVTKLDDGTTSTEYWNVPNISPATVASVRTTLQAAPPQAPSQNYVQAAEVSLDPLASKIPRAGADGKLAESWIPNSVAAPLVHDGGTSMLSCPGCELITNKDANAGYIGRDATGGATVPGAMSAGPRNGFAGGWWTPDLATTDHFIGSLDRGAPVNTGLTVFTQASNSTLSRQSLFSALVPTAAAAHDYVSVEGDTYMAHASGTANVAIGVQGQASNEATGNTTTVAGVSGMSWTDSAPEIRVTDLIGLWARGNQGTTGRNATNSYGVKIEAPGLAAIHNYGLFVANDPNANANTYAAYIEGGKSYFGGPVEAQTVNGARNADSFAGADIGAKINAACAAGSGVVEIPAAAACRPFATRIVGANGCTIRGQGVSGSCLQWTGANDGTAVEFANLTAARIENVSLSTTVGGTMTAITFAGCNRCSAHHVLINGANDGTGWKNAIRVMKGTANSFLTFLDHMTVLSSTGAGLTVDHATETTISDSFIAGIANNTTGTNVVLDSGASGFYATNLSTLYGAHGLKVTNSDPAAGAPIWLFFTHFLADTTSGGAAWLFDSSLGNHQVSAHFVNSWAAGAGNDGNGNAVTPTASGVQIDGGKQIYITGGSQIRANRANGILVNSANASEIHIDAADIVDNNLGNNADAHGLYVASASPEVTIQNSRIGNVNAGHMKYGIKVGAVAAAGFRASGNDLDNNESGAYSDSNTAGSNMVCTTANSLLLNACDSPQGELDLGRSGGSISLGYNYAGTNSLLKVFSQPHQAGNAGTGLQIGVADGGGLSGEVVRNVRTGSYNSQQVEFWTAHGGVVAATERIRVPYDGGLRVFGGTKPSCDTEHRGTIFTQFNSAGVTDTADICRKDASDAYAWQTIYGAATAARSYPLALGATTATFACSNGGGTNTYLGAQSSSTTETSVNAFVPTEAYTISRMYVTLNANVPASQTVTATVMDNASAQPVTCSIAAGTNSCNDTAHSFTTTPGHKIDVRLNCAGGTSSVTGPVSVGLGLK